MYLDIVTFAKASGKSISTVRRSVKDGKINYKRQGGKIFILTDSAFIDEMAVFSVNDLKRALIDKELIEELKKVKNIK